MGNGVFRLKFHSAVCHHQDRVSLAVNAHISRSSPDPADQRGGLNVKGVSVCQFLCHIKKEVAFLQVKFQRFTLCMDVSLTVFLHGNELRLIQRHHDQAFVSCRNALSGGKPHLFFDRLLFAVFIIEIDGSDQPLKPHHDCRYPAVMCGNADHDPCYDTNSKHRKEYKEQLLPVFTGFFRGFCLIV